MDYIWVSIYASVYKAYYLKIFYPESEVQTHRGFAELMLVSKI